MNPTKEATTARDHLNKAFKEATGTGLGSCAIRGMVCIDAEMAERLAKILAHATATVRMNADNPSMKRPRPGNQPDYCTDCGSTWCECPR